MVRLLSSKYPLIWMIDPFYTDERGDASNARLLRVVMMILAELLGGTYNTAESIDSPTCVTR